MSFERVWLKKLAAALEGNAGPELANEILQGSEDFSEFTSSSEVISWTAGAVEKLNSLLPPDMVNEIVTACACHYPLDKLIPIRDAFRLNGDFSRAISMLNKQFSGMLMDSLGFDVSTVEKLLENGMGPGGILEENRIVATKIPKSRNLREWLAASDPDVRRKLYCHCPRIREAVEHGISIPVEYCLCGAGFYRNIWEVVTELPVRVEMLKSVMDGDSVCSIAIYPSALKA